MTVYFDLVPNNNGFKVKYLKNGEEHEDRDVKSPGAYVFTYEEYYPGNTYPDWLGTLLKKTD